MSTRYAEALRRQVTLSAWWTSVHAAQFELMRLEHRRDLLADHTGRLQELRDRLRPWAEGGPYPDADEAVEKLRDEDQEAYEQLRRQAMLAVALEDDTHELGTLEWLGTRADALRRARAYYVTEQMADLVNTAYSSRPPEKLQQTHLPAPAGFMWLEAPAVFAYEVERDGFRGSPGFSAISWEPATVTLSHLDEDGRQERSAVRITPWVHSSVFRGRTGDRARAWGEYLPWPFLWPLGRETALEEPRAVDWRGRWLVRGFWRNQWYPASQEHRPLWIDDYVKGPEDRPFLVRERVTVWRR